MMRCMIFCLTLLVSLSAFADKITVYRTGREVLIQSRWSEELDIVIRVYRLANEGCYLVKRGSDIRQAKRGDIAAGGFCVLNDQIPETPESAICRAGHGPIIAGRDFREEDKRNTFIFNESARLAFGLTDVEGENADFVGIIPDIQTFSFRKEIVPTGFALYQGGHQYYILRIDSPKNFREVTAYVKNVIQDLYGSTDGLEIFTADEALDNTYVYTS